MQVGGALSQGVENIKNVGDTIGFTKLTPKLSSKSGKSEGAKKVDEEKGASRWGI